MSPESSLTEIWQHRDIQLWSFSLTYILRSRRRTRDKMSWEILVILPLLAAGSVVQASFSLVARNQMVPFTPFVRPSSAIHKGASRHDVRIGGEEVHVKAEVVREVAWSQTTNQFQSLPGGGGRKIQTFCGCHWWKLPNHKNDWYCCAPSRKEKIRRSFSLARPSFSFTPTLSQFSAIFSLQKTMMLIDCNNPHLWPNRPLKIIRGNSYKCLEKTFDFVGSVLCPNFGWRSECTPALVNLLKTDDSSPAAVGHCHASVLAPFLYLIDSEGWKVGWLITLRKSENSFAFSNKDSCPYFHLRTVCISRYCVWNNHFWSRVGGLKLGLLNLIPENGFPHSLSIPWDISGVKCLECHS